MNNREGSRSTMSKQNPDARCHSVGGVTRAPDETPRREALGNEWPALTHRRPLVRFASWPVRAHRDTRQSAAPTGAGFFGLGPAAARVAWCGVPPERRLIKSARNSVRDPGAEHDRWRG